MADDFPSMAESTGWISRKLTAERSQLSSITKNASKDSFSWAEFYYGLDIQLAVYMLAVRNAGGKFADDIAGAFYMPIEVGPENIELGKSIDNNPKFAHKARGIFNGDYASSLDTNAAQRQHLL